MESSAEDVSSGKVRETWSWWGSAWEEASLVPHPEMRGDRSWLEDWAAEVASEEAASQGKNSELVPGEPRSQWSRLEKKR